MNQEVLYVIGKIYSNYRKTTKMIFLTKMQNN